MLFDAQDKHDCDAMTALALHRHGGKTLRSPLKDQDERSPVLKEAEYVAFKLVIQSPTWETHWLH